MPEAISAALAHDGLVWLMLGAFAAGAVRGFAGFGTAMVFLPVAALFLSPVWALIALVVMDAFGPLPNLRRAVRDGRMGDLGWLLAGTVVALPVGLSVLYAVSPVVFRYAVSIVALSVPFILMTGVRLRRTPGQGLLLGTGLSAGFLGGVSGLSGPPVILLYMATGDPVRIVRANNMLFLFAYTLLLLAVLAVQGRIEGAAVVIGLMLAVPNVIGNMTGAAIFRPERARLYRAAGYGLIVMSAMGGLPVWDAFG
ncbi:sulfite exporter TauE/SafE family protein [Sediminimonas qiaohouensis]|nr:sulfite exporter TauE/SafE family protein [Sediminimonas qiaohouensis]